MWWIIESLLIVFFLLARKRYFDKSMNWTIWPIQLYLGWCLISIIRGVYVADNYWEWKTLFSTSLVLLLPLSIFISMNTYFVQSVLRTWLKIALPLFFVIVIFLRGDALGHYLVPISVLALFLPILPTKWKVIALFFLAVVILGSLDSRSNVIKFSVALALGLLFYIRRFISKFSFETLRLSLLLLPIIMFSIGTIGMFNVFQIDKYVKGSYTTNVVMDGKTYKNDLTADSRTSVYMEVISSAIRNDYYIFGRTPARGYDSKDFGYLVAKLTNSDKLERAYSEVSILNIFTWTGIVGVVLYFFVFFRATYLAINRSDNFFMRVVGLFIAFRWTYAWVEDFSSFDLSYLFLWVLIGMCFSTQFRQMTNDEMKAWVIGLLPKLRIK
ncbi:MAG: hypothetical protein PHV20_14290 [Bacteroidales bacterium]|nr:hypothetical protein [Bacteroidales bacterium]